MTTQPEPTVTTQDDTSHWDEDYDRVRQAIAFISETWRDQPDLDEIARNAGLSPAHFHRLFSRWAGISPKEFVQALTLDHARALLKGSATILDTAYEVGLSGPGRLHDLFIDHEAMTPGDYKRRGSGLEIVWGYHVSPFGLALVMATDRGVAGVAFADDETEQPQVFEDMARRWPAATYLHAPDRTAPYATRIFTPELWRKTDPLKVVLIGTDFEVRVWDALLRLPMGQAITYSDLASHVCSPRAARAVGTAVGRNPISFVVPCHRVLRKDGGLGGYHWGITRKQAIIGWESGRLAQDA
ncbi:MAG: bifunctional helix-turn-helix domain-containing protein/methylated-DNA--[protein]-cysteine S-methyltransferase [Hyphomicrobiaceae bacterium]|nr:bifunctional helix-turn-helix domain-containing protein/methylated-DNA--[protein]-cysteine S-methyltransferase [Hyphomicrobiaceae bacterium]